MTENQSASQGPSPESLATDAPSMLKDEQARAYVELILSEKTHRISEMQTYNQRLDKIITIYISGLYAAIGFAASGKIPFDFFAQPYHVPVAFLFVFLNLCLLHHGLSQSFWAMSLAKYIYITYDKRLSGILFNDYFTSMNKPPANSEMPPFSLLWDDWQNDMKGDANLSRNVVVGLWFILVQVISIAVLGMVDFKTFYETHSYLCWIWIFVASFLLLWVCYLGARLVFFAKNFDGNPDDDKTKKWSPWPLVCGFILASIFCFAAYKVISNSQRPPIRISVNDNALPENSIPPMWYHGCPSCHKISGRSTTKL